MRQSQIRFQTASKKKNEKQRMLCAVCSNPNTKKCARCHLTYYCSGEHQKQDWFTRHKYVCIEYPFAAEVSNVSKMMFAWYKEANEAPQTTLEEKRTVTLEWMNMLHIATTIDTLPHKSMIQNAIALQLIILQLDMRINSKSLERMLAKVQSDCQASHKHVIAQIKQKMIHLEESGNLNSLRAPSFDAHTRTHSILHKAPRSLSYPGLQVVVDEKMNGLDVIADRCFKQGEIVLVDTAFAAASLDTVGMCYHCGTLFVQKPIECRNNCGMHYCNAECETRAFSRYHAPLCSHAGVSQLRRTLIMTANEDPDAVGALKYAVILFKLCGMQMLSTQSPIWEQEPLCYLHCSDNESSIDELKLRYRMLPYFVFMQVMFAMGHENENFERPKMIGVRWFFQMTQYLWAHVFGGGYDKLTIPLDIHGTGSMITFAFIATLFNHSCIPNIVSNSSRVSMSNCAFVALRDIAKGESLRISYLKHPNKETLRDKYNFDCDCARCNPN